MRLQVGGAVPQSPIELLAVATTETRIVVGITLLLSVSSWFVIGLKWWQLRRVRSQGERFRRTVQEAPRLADQYRATTAQAPSAWGRLLRQAVTFYGELRPGGLTGGATGAITPTQLEALKLMLAREIAVAREQLQRYVAWLAIVGSVSPLLGLLGTVFGIMNAFIGIGVRGSGNLAAVAPGVAEALVTTAVGLLAAIPAVLFYNVFVTRVRFITGELEGYANELVGAMAREGLV